MLQQSKAKTTSGFTLIEVVLALAIGSLIFLLAFLTFQQVSKNRRDTQRKSDARRLLAYIEEFATNNNGGYPCESRFVGKLQNNFGSRPAENGLLSNTSQCGNMRDLLESDSTFNFEPAVNTNGISSEGLGYNDPSVSPKFRLLAHNNFAYNGNLTAGLVMPMIGVRCSGSNLTAVESAQAWAVRVGLENGSSYCVSNT